MDNLDKKRKLGVFFTCFDEFEATRVSLNHLKSVYPDIPVYLVYEGDINFKVLEREISNLTVNQVPDTMSEALRINFPHFHSPKDQAVMKKALLAVIERLEAAISHNRSEYILMLDPDAIVHGKLTIPNVGLLGCRCNVNPGVLSELNKTLTKYGGIEITAWGATPAIFNVEKFLKAKTILLNTPNLVDELCMSFYWMFAHDILLASLFSLIGESETFNPELLQCEYNPNLSPADYPLLHQFRKYYPKRTSKYKSRQS